MSTSRVWLFRALVAIAAVVMVVSAAMPWWTCDVRTSTVGDYIVQVYQYGIPAYKPDYALTERLHEYVASDITPYYQTVLAWIYVAASVGLALFSTWVKGRKGKWLLGGIGLTYIAYAAIAIIWIYLRTKSGYGIKLQGLSQWFAEGEIPVTAFSTIEQAHYLAYVAGAMFVVLALLRDFITGKPKLEALVQAPLEPSDE